MPAIMFFLIVESLRNTSCSGNTNHKKKSIIRAICPRSSLLLSPTAIGTVNCLLRLLKAVTTQQMHLTFPCFFPWPGCRWHRSALISFQLHLCCAYEPGQRCLPHPVPVLGWDMSITRFSSFAPHREKPKVWSGTGAGAVGQSGCTPGSPFVWTGTAFEYFGFCTLVQRWQTSLKTHRKTSQTTVIVIIITSTALCGLKP